MAVKGDARKIFDSTGDRFRERGFEMFAELRRHYGSSGEDSLFIVFTDLFALKQGNGQSLEAYFRDARTIDERFREAKCNLPRILLNMFAVRGMT